MQRVVPPQRKRKKSRVFIRVWTFFTVHIFHDQVDHRTTSKPGEDTTKCKSRGPLRWPPSQKLQYSKAPRIFSSYLISRRTAVGIKNQEYVCRGGTPAPRAHQHLPLAVTPRTAPVVPLGNPCQLDDVPMSFHHAHGLSSLTILLARRW